MRLQDHRPRPPRAPPARPGGCIRLHRTRAAAAAADAGPGRRPGAGAGDAGAAHPDPPLHPRDGRRQPPFQPLAGGDGAGLRGRARRGAVLHARGRRLHRRRARGHPRLGGAGAAGATPSWCGSPRPSTPCAASGSTGGCAWCPSCRRPRRRRCAPWRPARGAASSPTGRGATWRWSWSSATRRVARSSAASIRAPSPRWSGAAARSCWRSSPACELLVSGNAGFDHFARLGMERFRLLNVAVTLLLLVLLRLLLGTWRAGLLLMLVVGWAGAVVYAGMAASGVPIDLLSTGLFLMLSVAAVEDFIFVSWEQLARGASWRQAFRRLLLPGFLTSVTTVVGFASLCVSELEVVRRFGLFGGPGGGAGVGRHLPGAAGAAPALARGSAPGPRRRGPWGRGCRPASWPWMPRRAAWALLLVLVRRRAGGAPSRVRRHPGGHVRRRPPLPPGRRLLGADPRLDRAALRGLPRGRLDGRGGGDGGRPARPARAWPRCSIRPRCWRDLTRGDPLALFELAAERDKLAGASGALQAPGGRLRASVLVERRQPAGAGAPAPVDRGPLAGRRGLPGRRADLLRRRRRRRAAHPDAEPAHLPRAWWRC